MSTLSLSSRSRAWCARARAIWKISRYHSRARARYGWADSRGMIRAGYFIRLGLSLSLLELSGERVKDRGPMHKRFIWINELTSLGVNDPISLSLSLSLSPPRSGHKDPRTRILSLFLRASGESRGLALNKYEQWERDSFSFSRAAGLYLSRGY